jgi:hypothetical protein
MKFDKLLTERNRDDVPKLAGRYVDDKGQPVTIKPTEYSNTFIVSPPSGQAEVRVTMENIAPNRFLVQGQMDGTERGLPTFFTSVAEIVKNKITLYFFFGLEEKIAELGKKHQVTFELIGINKDPKSKEVETVTWVLTAYESVDGVIGFYNDLFNLEGAQKITITKK